MVGCFIKPYESEIRITAFEIFLSRFAMRCLHRGPPNAGFVHPVHIKQTKLIIT